MCSKSQWVHRLRAILVFAMPEIMKTQSDSHFFSAPRSFEGSNVLKQFSGDDGTQLTVGNYLLGVLEFIVLTKVFTTV